MVDTLYISGNKTEIYGNIMNIQNGHFLKGAGYFNDVEPFNYGKIEFKNSTILNIYA